VLFATRRVRPYKLTGSSIVKGTTENGAPKGALRGALTQVEDQATLSA
jgi:hypothetical protein